MSYVILIMVLLAILHFIYDGIVAPSLRLEARYRLFSLRDELRELKKIRGNELQDRHFANLQSMINTMLGNLSQFDIGTIYRMEREFRNDQELKKRVEARVRLMDDCKDPDALKLRQKAVLMGFQATAVNSGAWFLYLLPIISVASSFNAVKARVKPALSLTTNDLKRVIPDQVSSDHAAYV